MTKEEVAQTIGALARKYGRNILTYRLVLHALDSIWEHYYRGQEKRHLSGQELSIHFFGYAFNEFGLAAHGVLAFHGIYNSNDLGEIVYELVEVDVLQIESTDSRRDFEGAAEYTAGAFAEKYQHLLAIISSQ
jgi:uncharacterized repeat protein (TIGR04138 family)